MGFGRWVLGVRAVSFFLWFCSTVCPAVRWFVCFSYTLEKGPQISKEDFSVSMFSCTPVPGEWGYAYGCETSCLAAGLVAQAQNGSGRLYFCKTYWDQLNGLIRTFPLKKCEKWWVCELTSLESWNNVNTKFWNPGAREFWVLRGLALGDTKWIGKQNVRWFVVLCNEKSHIYIKNAQFPNV